MNLRRGDIAGPRVSVNGVCERPESVSDAGRDYRERDNYRQFVPRSLGHCEPHGTQAEPGRPSRQSVGPLRRNGITSSPCRWWDFLHRPSAFGRLQGGAQTRRAAVALELSFRRGQSVPGWFGARRTPKVGGQPGRPKPQDSQELESH